MAEDGRRPIRRPLPLPPGVGTRGLLGSPEPESAILNTRHESGELRLKDVGMFNNMNTITYYIHNTIIVEIEVV